MKDKINRDFYCSVDHVQMGEYEPSACYGKKHGKCEGCSAYHRKWPTPKQYEEKYGRKYSADMPVWMIQKTIVKGKQDWREWELHSFLEADFISSTFPIVPTIIVCACTPWGKPP